MTRRLVRTGMAAKEIGVSRAALQRWAKSGALVPESRLPNAKGEYRWDLDDLRKQISARRPATEQEAPVPHPADKPQDPAVIAAIVTSRLGVLAGRRNDKTPPWTFIAGENEPGESPADTIIREVKEETGLLIKAGATIGQRVHPKTGRLMVYVAATPAGRSREVFVGDEDELAEVRWLTLAEADELLPGMFAPVRLHLRRVLTNASAKGRKTPKNAQPRLI